MAGAAILAAAELLLTLTLGRFFSWGRAEALLFLAYRPWLLVAAALAAARFRLAARATFYALALLLAATSETLLLLVLGAADPLPEAVRGIAAALLLVIPIDLLVQAGRSLLPRWGGIAAALVALAILQLPGALAPYEALALGEERGEARTKPDLMVMTGLPIIWGEAGAFDLRAKPAPAYRALQQEHSVRPLDVLDERSLSGGRLLLLAQPRALAPAELVALDDWVRQGGRVLILTDPTLIWPSELPIGDIRRPPQTDVLAPLLAHWGLALEPAEPGLRVEQLGRRRLVMAAPGRLLVRGQSCRLERAFLAACRIGRGTALLLADADLVDERLWAAPGTSGGRHERTADNPLVVADLLDRLAGLRRRRAAGEVAWLAAGASPARALAVAALPILAALVAALLLWRRGGNLATAHGSAERLKRWPS